MSIKSFKFVSPGVFINEIDNSFIPKTADVIGPVVIGRSAYGQALRPTKVDSFSEFIENFGYPIAGGRGADVSRNGNNIGPTYGPFAAQAYLNSKVGPITFVRLLGAQHDDAATAGKAGWSTANLNTSVASNGGAYGLLIVPSASIGTVVTGTLAAVWYLKEGHSLSLSLVVQVPRLTGTSTHSLRTFKMPVRIQFTKQALISMITVKNSLEKDLIPTPN